MDLEFTQVVLVLGSTHVGLETGATGLFQKPGSMGADLVLGEFLILNTQGLV